MISLLSDESLFGDTLKNYREITKKKLTEIEFSPD